MKEKQIFITDDDIIELYWQREEHAIEETDNKYGELLFRIAYNILNDKCDSEECQNDTYLGIWNAIPPTRPSVFPAFIVQIMRRIAIDCYRRKTNKKSVPSEFKVSMDDLCYCLQSEEKIDSNLNAKELGKLISNYVKGLSNKQQYIFVSRFYMSNSIDTIAKEMNVTSSSVYKSIEKIKRGLKEYLIRKGVDL
ncbi:MAG: sigma-70 family RNA polymerase sigma factor [Clostridia bacterium]|nr:sigma-70 family RNA polymerase sigma factor [Clostridia bacterium]